MGFYLMAEAFDEWNKRWHYGWSEDPSGKKPFTYHKFFNQWAETDLKDMVKRDRNHASVFMYSVGNEVPDQRFADGPKTLKMLIDWVKEEDDTRMVTATCDWAPWANASGFLDSMDIAGYNYPDRYFKEHYREEHASYPDRILLGAENYETLENWIAVRDNPYVVGLFLWVGIDYIGESLGWPRRGWEWGLVDIGSFEKTMYYYWQAFWSEKPMVHIAVNLKEKDTFKWRCYDVASHWNFNPEVVDTIFVYSNTEKVELFQNGKSLGKKEVNPDTYQAIFIVDYKKGELKAKAYNNKINVATHSIKTAGEPTKLKLIYERKSVAKDSDRLIFLTLEVQDNNGTRCPFACNEITVDIEGAGELIGLDSGNQFSHELYKQNKRKAYDGRLLLTIRPKGKGSISVKCHTEGLKAGTFDIQN
jgi:beta-galactosidase